MNQSTAHEGLTALLKANPQLICELWERAFGRRLPPGVARARDINLRVRSLSGKDRYLQVDVVVTIHAPGDLEGPALFAFGVEVQLYPNDEKRFTWVEYLAALRREHRCSAEVLVFSPEPGVIGWAKRLFVDEAYLCPRLFGQDQIPIVDDERSALRQPALAVLSAVFRVETEAAAKHLKVALLGLFALPAWQRTQYIALLEETFPEELMDENDPILQQLAQTAQESADRTWRRSYAYAKQVRYSNAVREGLWAVVELRGLEVDDEQRARVEACDDPEQLSRWLVRLKTVERFADALCD